LKIYKLLIDIFIGSDSLKRDGNKATFANYFPTKGRDPTLRITGSRSARTNSSGTPANALEKL